MTRAKLKARTKEAPGPLETPCWIWQKYICEGGYGIINLGGKNQKAHRVSFILFNGPIPDGCEVHHRCRIESCIAPDHLQAVTHLEHGRLNPRAMSPRCGRGHEFTPENTQLRANGTRQCKACLKRTQAELYRKQKAARAAWQREYYRRHRAERLEYEKNRYQSKKLAELVVD